MYYFYTSEGQTEGPVSMEVLEDYFSQKKINAKTMIFQEGGARMGRVRESGSKIS